MEALLRDLRYGARMLIKTPGYAAIAILTLALGIGANTALFSVVNGVLLNPLPYAHSDRLVAMYEQTQDFPGHSSISYPNFLDWQRDNRSFSSIAAFRADHFILTGGGRPQRLKVEMVSATFFPLLGVKPVTGRDFTTDEDRVGGAPVVLLAGGFWKSKFAGASDVVGKTLTLNSTVYTIVGVMPQDFRYQAGNFHSNPDIFTPIGQWNDPTFRDRRIGMGMDAVGLLKPGVTLTQAQEDMDAVSASLARTYPNADKTVRASLEPLRQNIIGNIRPYLLVLLAAVAFVLLIACANVANLLLARSTGRTREFAIRSALGASPWRVVRQLLTESVLLAMIGGALGLGVAAWGTQAALGVLPSALPLTQQVHLDGRVLLFTLAATLLAGILFGLAPALKARQADVHETLKEGGRGGSGKRHGTQRLLVAVEMALAVVLLVGAGLMIRSLSNLWSVNPGFDPHNVLTFEIGSPAALAPTADGMRAVFQQIHDRLNALPGIQAASLTVGSMPMAGDSELPFWIEGQPKPTSESEMKSALFYAVNPEYLKVMKVPLLRGRFLNAEDNHSSHFVIDIDEQFAHLYFANQDPIGKQVNFAILGSSAEIVGVVGHVKQWGLGNDQNGPVLAQFYLPLSQIPDPFWSLLNRGVGVIVRTQGSPLSAVGTIRDSLNDYNSQLVMFGTETLNEIISDSLASRRFMMILLGVFAALALSLSSIGIYGVVSYLVGQRQHEIGIRMALGAQRMDVLRMILGEGVRMALIGVGVGLLVALGLTRLMAKMLFGVRSYDPLTFFGVAIVLTGVALAACYRPARRAMRTDPAISLRYE